MLPANRRALLATVDRMNPPPDVRAELERLPADRSFATVYEIWEALGHRNEA